MTVTVDDPRQTDVASLVRASDAFAQSIYPTDTCSSLSIPELLADGVTVFVARDAEHRALGMAALVDRGDGSGELRRLYVDESGRGQGVATAVMDALEAAARAASIRVLQLQTGPLHHAAIALYERRGYARIERFGPYADDGYSVCMEKSLG